MADEPLRVNRSLVIPAAELSWRFSRSGGPGGQHANTADTRAEVTFDVRSSRALGPRQRDRLLERLGPVVTAAASEERSQARNRDIARRRLAGTLAGALRRETPRRPTRPSKTAVERRLQAKAHRARRKAERRRPELD